MKLALVTALVVSPWAMRARVVVRVRLALALLFVIPPAHGDLFVAGLTAPFGTVLP